MTVSIIVPVYNARKYLRKTVRDLLGQTYRDLEMIFVDDGSEDGSGRVLDRLAERDERVCVLHQAHGGIASARNAGIAAASGEYLMFVDDDDRIPKGYVQEYVSCMEKTRADIVMGGYRRISPEGRTIFRRRLVRHSRIGAPQPEWLAYINVAPWAKIYRSDFVKKCGAHFLDYPYGEDIYFHMMLLAQNPVIAYSGSTSYGWVDRKESVSNTVHRGLKDEADILPMLDKVLEVHPQRDELFGYFIYRHCAYHIYMAGRDVTDMQLKDEFRRCRLWLREKGLRSPISPFSKSLKGELLRDRAAVALIWVTTRLCLEKHFSRIYCKEIEEKGKIVRKK